MLHERWKYQYPASVAKVQKVDGTFVFVVIDGMHRLVAVWQMIEEQTNPAVWFDGAKIPCLVYNNPPAALVLKWAKKNELLQGIANEKPSVLDHITWVCSALQCHMDDGTVLDVEAWFAELQQYAESNQERKETVIVKERQKSNGLTRKEIGLVARLVKSLTFEGVSKLATLCNQDNASLFQSLLSFTIVTSTRKTSQIPGFDQSNAKAVMKDMFIPNFPTAGFLPKQREFWCLFRQFDDLVWTKKENNTWHVQPHILVFSACHAWWVLKGAVTRLPRGKLVMPSPTRS